MNAHKCLWLDPHVHLPCGCIRFSDGMLLLNVECTYQPHSDELREEAARG